MVRIRQLLDQMRHRLSLTPILFVLAAVATSQAMLALDRSIDTTDLPLVLQTTVESGRAILSAIAAGLISSITLLLSMMLLAVQLASSQFSPRSVRNWIGDRTQQRTIGVVLGTTIYCLLVLRETRTFDEGDALTPHFAVLLGLALGVASLIAVVHSVDHLTNRLRIGNVASGLLTETVELIEQRNELHPLENPSITPAAKPNDADRTVDIAPGALAVTATSLGWVQQIDDEELLEHVPDRATLYVPVAIGSFVMPGAPLAWVWPALDDSCAEGIRGAFALGDTRTMQQDVGFGILQMVDIAVRALSPGVNDPNTANDLIAHLGVAMLTLWERPEQDSVIESDGRTLIRHDLTHADYLHAAFDSIRRYGASDPDVAITIIRTLVSLRDEVTRRDLPGPLAPIDEVIEQTLDTVERSDNVASDKDAVRRAAITD